VCVAVAKWFFVFPPGGNDAESQEFILDILTQIGSLLRLCRFIVIGFIAWRLIRGEFDVRAWYQWCRERIRGINPALAREA
jgi:hypothetical protein